MEQHRETQRQFEQASRAAKLVAYQNSRLAPSSKVFVPRSAPADHSIACPPLKNKLKVESTIFKPSLTFKSKK